jgi:hypothetical protein
LEHEDAVQDRSWQLEKWLAGGPKKLYRWLKFRERGYVAHNQEDIVLVAQLVLRALQTQDAFIELMSEIARRAKTPHTLQNWWVRLKHDLKKYAGLVTERRPGEQVTIWEHDKDCVSATILRTLGKGAQGHVYEITTPFALPDAPTQALKCGNFNSMKNEVLIFLKVNHPHSHPNVLRADFVHALNESNELLCLMERIEGPTDGVRDLEQAIKSGVLFEGADEEVSARLASLTAQLAFALEYLHSLGVVHRDVKPANLLIDKHWRLVLMDFGISSIGKCESRGRVVNAELKGCTPTFCSEEDYTKFKTVCDTGVSQQCTHHADVFCFVSTVLEMYSGTVDGSWRGGRPLRELWKTTTQELELPITGYFGHMPTGLLLVLKEALENDGITMEQVTAKLLVLHCAGVPAVRPSLAKGIDGSKAVLMYDRIGAALHDRAKLEEALAFYQLAVALEGSVDDTSASRMQNNAGVVFQRLGRFDEAVGRYEKALQLQKDYPIANNNLARLHSSTHHTEDKSTGVMDTSGTQAAFKVEGLEALEATLHYYSGQRLVLAGSLGECQVMRVDEQTGVHHVSAVTGGMPSKVVELVSKCYQLWTPSALFQSVSLSIEEEVRIRINVSTSTGTADPEWQYGVCVATIPAEKQDIQGAIDKATEAKACRGQEGQHSELPSIDMQVRWDNAESGKLESLACIRADCVEPAALVRYADGQSLFVFRKSAWCHGVVKGSIGPTSSTHTVQIDGESLAIVIDLNGTNHTPALFASLECMAQALQLYRIQLTSEHKCIYDIFSGQELSTLTQTATLQYREKERAQQMLAKDEDFDRKWHEDDAESTKFRHERKASQIAKPEADQQGVRVTNILKEMLGNPGRRDVGFLTKTLLLILGPAASGKTTLFKTFIMEILQSHPDVVPILIPVIELVGVSKDCQSSDSVIVSYLKSKHGQHTHVLLQAMLQHRAVFLIDGIDESGSERDTVQNLVTAELLAPGHNTIITSRHGGFSNDAFKQCRLLELLPLTPTQQSEMVKKRMPDEEKAAERLIGTLSSESASGFEEIAGNPLMLTMLISVYISNDHQIVANKTELYEKAIQTIVGRTDKLRAGLAPKEQAEVMMHLQQLAFHSHIRTGERRIFTAEAAGNWISGWSATILPALMAGRLPILSSMGLNANDEEEWRFTHLTYQEFLTAQEVVKRVTESAFSADKAMEIFGKPNTTFTDPRWQVMLPMCADLLTPKRGDATQLAAFAAVLFGGRIDAKAKSATTTVSSRVRKSSTALICGVEGCSQMHVSS